MDAQVGARRAGFAAGLSLVIPITLSTMAIVLLAPILPQMMHAFSGVRGHAYLVPMVLTVPALCVALFSPLAGWLGDRFGRRRLLIGALILYAVVGLAPIFLADLGAILVSRIGVGIAETLIVVLTTTLIGDYFDGRARDKWLAAQSAVANLSALLFFTVGGMLGSFGWRTAFWVYSSALVMLVGILVFTWEPGRVRAATAHPAHPAQGRWAGFPWKGMLGVIGTTLYGSILFYTVQIQTSSALAAHGVSDPARIGLLTAIAATGAVIGTLAYARVSAWPLGRLLMIAFALLTAGFTLMATARDVNPLLLGCFLNQLGCGILLPTLLVWAMNLLPFEMRGRGAGMWQSAFFIGQFLSPIAVTTLALGMGGLLPSFGAFAAMALLGLLGGAVLAVRRYAPSVPPGICDQRMGA